MKKLASILILGIFINPLIVNAGSDNIGCSINGYTVATINGIFTDESGARENKKALERLLNKTHNNEKLKVDYLHNPSHLGGIRDITDSAIQKTFDSMTVEDYDLIEMIKDASEKVATQKLLLVAHSQGNFYANSFYDAVSIPEESLGIYSVATPSGRVAGDGKWLTSDTDKVIADWVSKFPFGKIMEPNTHIVLKDGDDFAGHSFTDVYLKYRAGEIASDIEASLTKLKSDSGKNLQKSCIDRPQITFTHRAQGVALAVLDPIAGGVVSGAAASGKAAIGTAQVIGSVISKAVTAITARNPDKIEPTSLVGDISSAIPSKIDKVMNVEIPHLVNVYEITETTADIKSKLEVIQARVDQIKSQEVKTQKVEPVPPPAVVQLPPLPKPALPPILKITPPSTTPVASSYGGSSGSPHPQPTTPPAATASLTFSPSSPANEEIIILLSASNLDSASYDVKISIESENVLSNIYSDGVWESSNFYITNGISGPTVSAKEFRLAIKDDKQSFRGSANIFLKLRKNGASSGELMFSGNINIAEPVVTPPPPPVTPPPPPPPTPPPSPEPTPVPPPPPAEPPPPPPPASQISNADHIVISEVQTTGGAGQTANDFIEIYNPTENQVNLSGYRLVKRTASGETDSLIKSWTGDAFIPPRGFYLWANSGYVSISTLPDITTSATIADNNGIAIRLGPNDTGEIIDSVGWGESANVFIEHSAFPANPEALNSIERKSVSNGACVSPDGDYKFSGNDCDTDKNADDFVNNSNPTPQNSSSLVEPRQRMSAITPSPGSSIVSYDKDKMKLVLSWMPPDGSSDLTYIIKDASGASQKFVDIETALTSAEIPVSEVGRDYKLSFQAFDKDGLGSEIVLETVAIPSFFSSLNFYNDPRASGAGNVLLEARYPKEGSLIPDPYSNASDEFIVIFYLNSDAYLESSETITQTWVTPIPNEDKTLKIKYRNCSNDLGSERRYLSLPANPNVCKENVNGLSLKADFFEDGVILLNAVPNEGVNFSSSDYVTAAFYAVSDINSLGKHFKLVAADRIKYFFQDSPSSHASPSVPQIAISSYTQDSPISDVSISLSASTDPDTVDAFISYEYSLDNSDFASLGSTIRANLGGTYQMSVRAYDDFGSVSDITTISFTLEMPPGIDTTPDASNPYFAVDEVKFDGALKIKWRFISNPAPGKVFSILPYELSTGKAVGATRPLTKLVVSDFNNGYTARDSSAPCSVYITPTTTQSYLPGLQYETEIMHIGDTPINSDLIGKTLKFNLFVGNPCDINVRDQVPLFDGLPIIVIGA